MVVVGFSPLANTFGRMYIHSFPTCGFFFKVEISSCIIIPLFRPESIHSGSASWDDFGREFPDKLRISSFPRSAPTLCLGSGIVSPLRLRWVKGVTCHLHFWQNDRGLLRATSVTRGWNGHRLRVSTKSYNLLLTQLTSLRKEVNYKRSVSVVAQFLLFVLSLFCPSINEEDCWQSVPASWCMHIKPNLPVNRMKWTTSRVQVTVNQSFSFESSPFCPSINDENWSKTYNRWKERFSVGWNRTKRAKFRGSPLFQATYNIKTEKQTIDTTYQIVY